MIVNTISVCVWLVLKINQDAAGMISTWLWRKLKESNSNLKIVAAVPHPDDLVQGLRSLEEGFIPPVLDESLLDGRLIVDSETSFSASRNLMEKEGIFAGISSGASVHTAQRLAEDMDKGNIVALLADGGWKYLSTQLWTRNYKDISDETQGKVWW